MCDGMRLLRDELPGGFDDGSRSDSKIVDQFVRLAAPGDRADGQLVYHDPFGADGAEDRIAESAVGVVTFDPEEAPLVAWMLSSKVARSMGATLYRSITRAVRPAAAPRTVCSAMKCSKNRSGNCLPKVSV